MEQGFAVDFPILADARGAPALPDDWRGTISHKRELALALVAPAEGLWRMGVDLEGLEERRATIASQVLTPNEMQRFGSDWQKVLVAFSLKEAVYKALDPFVHRFVGFKEAVVELHDDGSAEIQLQLKKREGPFVCEGFWRRMGGRWVVTSARIRPGGS